MIRRGPFRIKHTPSNKGGTLPEHWDLFIEGSDDSIATIWDSRAMALMFADYLVQWSAKREASRAHA